MKATRAFTGILLLLLVSAALTAGCGGVKTASTAAAEKAAADKAAAEAKKQKPKSPVRRPDAPDELSPAVVALSEARVAYSKRDYKTALPLYQKYREISEDISVDPEIAVCIQNLKQSAEFYYKLGVQLYLDEDYESAVANFNKALEADATHKGATDYKKRAELKIQALKKLEGSVK
ncbi:MAG: hypothetical protein IAF08_07175 [Rhizobacter sp.]|nr:hypothetical protein [Chlorobiales bacterium]